MNRLFITLMVSVIISLGAVARRSHRGYSEFIDWSNALGSEVWFEHTFYFYAAFSFRTAIRSICGYMSVQLSNMSSAPFYISYSE